MNRGHKIPEDHAAIKFKIYYSSDQANKKIKLQKVLRNLTSQKIVYIQYPLK